MRVCFVPAFEIIFLRIIYCIAGKRNDKKNIKHSFLKSVCFKQFTPNLLFAFFRHYEPGTYRCLVCGVRLFSSDTKYESGSGWPSFFDAIDGKRRLVTRADTSGGSKSVVVGVSLLAGIFGFAAGSAATGWEWDAFENNFSSFSFSFIFNIFS